jgi:S-formylglutathione hydrolase FrmB
MLRQEFNRNLKGERMALFHCEFFSNVLGIMAKMIAIIPQTSPGAVGVTTNAKHGADGFRTLYLLHGASDDETVWTRRTLIERYAEARGIAVIMPTTLRFFYTDTVSGYRYFTHVATEVPMLARQFFPLSTRREDNYVAGLSMGGYGAFKIALTFPEVFSAAVSLSGVMDIADFADQLVDAERRRELAGIFGEKNPRGSDNDLYHLVEKMQSSPQKPRFLQICGASDFLLEQNQNFAFFVRPLGYEHSYEEYPGTHEWGFWNDRIQHVLDWLDGKHTHTH